MIFLRNVAVLILISVVISTAQAEVLSVPSQYASIQSAVDAAGAADTVLVAAGTYIENVLIDSKVLVLLGDSVSQAAVIQSGANGVSVVSWRNVESWDAQLIGFTIEGASGAPGILCENSGVRVRRNLIQNNTGSGIRVTGVTTASISDNVITGNSAEHGGGISLDEGGAEISGNVISGNHANLGAGIFSDNRITMQSAMAASAIPGFTIRNNIISGNAATLGGGGAYLYEGFPVTFIGNLFAYDSANSGGGVANSGRFDLRFYNNTFDHCVGGDIGGSAIWWARGGSIGGVIRNNIVTNCGSTFNVGGAVGGDEEVVGLVDIDFNDLWNNTPMDYYRLQSGPNAIAVDPMYCDEQNGNYFLNAASACLTSGEGGQAIGAFGAGCQGVGPFASTLQASGEEPQHIINHTPTLMWQYYDPGAAGQTAFELECGTDAEWSFAELWQPSVVSGSETSATYAGAPLSDGQTWFARVRVYNGSDWSEWVTSQFRMNTPPGAPLLASPQDGDDITSLSPTLIVTAGIDPENDVQTFAFEVYSDAALSVLVRSRDFELSYDSAHLWQIEPSLPVAGVYWWRARGNDGYEPGVWSTAGSFRVDVLNDPPNPFALISPTNGSTIYSQTPHFDWEDANDPDPGDQINYYTLTVAMDSNFNFASSVSGILNSQYQYSLLPFGSKYWWRVTAYDMQGLSRMSEPASFRIPAPGDVDGNGIINLVDIVALTDVVFRGAAMPQGILAVDVNGDCVVDILDIIRLIGFILREDPAPVTPCAPLPPSGGFICVPADYPTIQSAVNAASSGDTICVSPNTYIESITIDGKSLVLLGDTIAQSVSVRSQFAGQPALYVLNSNAGACVVLGFRFVGEESAPAIRIDGADVTVRNSRVEDSPDGGIIVYGEGHVRIEDNVFSGNTGNTGAGVLLYYSRAEIRGNIFEGNRAYIGGAICCVGGSGSAIDRNILRGNWAEAGGGGVYLIDEGSISITRNLFVSDTSDHGGGIAISGRDSVEVLNNTFDGCVGGIGFGGGNAIWWANGSDAVCTFKNNIVTNSKSLNGLGGAVGCDPGLDGLVDVSFNAFLNNLPGNFYRFSPGFGSLTADPLYCNPVAEDYHLGPLSPCLGSGEGGVDRGAFGPGCLK